jgi:hypothetical protein
MMRRLRDPIQLAWQRPFDQTRDLTLHTSRLPPIRCVGLTLQFCTGARHAAAFRARCVSRSAVASVLGPGPSSILLLLWDHETSAKHGAATCLVTRLLCVGSCSANSKAGVSAWLFCCTSSQAVRDSQGKSAGAVTLYGQDCASGAQCCPDDQAA